MPVSPDHSKISESIFHLLILPCPQYLSHPHIFLALPFLLSPPAGQAKPMLLRAYSASMSCPAPG